METITEQRFVDRLIQALASLPQHDPRPLDVRGTLPASQPPISNAVNN